MMKKNIFLFFSIFLFAGALVNASSLPMMVFGKTIFDGTTYANQKVEIHNERLNFDWEVYTNDNGIYQVTLNNLKDDMQRSVINGDKIILKACPTEINPECEKVIYASEIPQEISTRRCRAL